MTADNKAVDVGDLSCNRPGGGGGVLKYLRAIPLPDLPEQANVPSINLTTASVLKNQEMDSKRLAGAKVAADAIKQKRAKLD